MSTMLLELTLRGSVLYIFVWLADRALRKHVQARSRRLWWLLAGLAFITPLKLPVIPAPDHLKSAVIANVHSWETSDHFGTVTWPPGMTGPATWIFALWLTGAVTISGATLIRSLRVSHHWRHERLSTDPAWLNLLEDCKADAGVTAPIGLVLSEKISTPALFGWLRPRILLPTPLVSALARPQLRAVLLHELAHFRALDGPLHWLFTLVRAIHWFNPCAHRLCRAWLRHREIEADEAALRWLDETDRAGYSEALIAALKHADAFPSPYGAPALGESVRSLKQRIAMINQHAPRARRGFLSIAIGFLMASAPFLTFAHAESSDLKTAAVEAMNPWLTMIDRGQYPQSWDVASENFKSHVTSQQWAAMAKSVRSPLGALKSRKLLSALYQTQVPLPGGKTLKGDFVIAQFSTVFENLAAARETVTFEKDTSGAWRASGYYIKPD